MTGLDGQPHVANPGAIFDNTESYNFEDVRSGLQQLDFLLNTSSPNDFYYTDNISSEPNFSATQKVLLGSQGTAIARNTAGTTVWMADSGSDLIEELSVNIGVTPNAVTSTGRTFKTQHRPFAITFNPAIGSQGTLFVADWGSELVEQVNIASGNSIAQADTGYASPTYPATNVESGEFNFYNAAWSNTGRKACSSCHFDELDTDGVGYSQGAIAPTTLAEVKPNHNLGTTGSYFWNGSFNNGNYTSLAFAFQTRDNCQIVEFGFTEGAGSDPATRVGDPNNLFGGVQAGQDDTQCRPIDGTAGIGGERGADHGGRPGGAEVCSGADPGDHWFPVREPRTSHRRLLGGRAPAPPNPLHQEYLAGQVTGAPQQLDSQTASDIAAGAALFNGSAGCATCHIPTDPVHPFTDDLNHGSGVSWIQNFVNTYQDNPIVTAALPGGFPETMLQAIPTSVTDDHEVNTWTRLDYFIFACFSLNNCIEFDDPLAVIGDTTEENRRLNLLLSINLEDVDRAVHSG